MRRVGCGIELGASRDRVWQVLTDFDAYPEWNPFLREVHAEPRAGSPLHLVGRLPVGVSLPFRGQVEVAEPPRLLAWQARPALLPRGLLAVVHVFELQDEARGRVRLEQYEDVSGHLVPMSGWMLRQVLTAQQEMLHALAERVART